MPGDGRERSAERIVGALRAAAIVSGIGFTMAVSVALGALGGAWLDRRWGTEPWLTVIGFLLGTIGGFLEMLRLVALAGKGKDRAG
ncbi:MAG: AtpZ/AtpI family protein [Armatimonadetes bacterium]|nr:AtpZ/AtpI family protein [Armatimonadota bacterium]